jgi:hypothetical protein
MPHFLLYTIDVLFYMAGVAIAWSVLDLWLLGEIISWKENWIIAVWIAIAMAYFVPMVSE